MGLTFGAKWPKRKSMKLFHKLLYLLFLVFCFLCFFYLYEVTDEFLRIQAERPFELIMPHDLDQMDDEQKRHI